MPVGATIGAIGSVASAGIGAYAADQAGKRQADAARSALAQQQKMFNDVVGYNQPYLDQGKAAQTSLAKLYGLTTPDNPGGASSQNDAWTNFTNLPAYQFPLQQGLLGLQRNLNAQGLSQSGAATKEAQQYGQGLASQYMMTNYVNPLQTMANRGATSASSLGGTAANFSNTMGQTQMGVGQAEASGIVGGANAINGGIGNLALYTALGRNGGVPTQNGNPVGGGLSSYTNVFGNASGGAGYSG